MKVIKSQKVIKRRNIFGILLLTAAIISFLCIFTGGPFNLMYLILSAVPGFIFVRTNTGPIYKENEITLKVTFYSFCVVNALLSVQLGSSYLKSLLTIVVLFSAGAPWGKNGYKLCPYSHDHPKNHIYKQWWFYVLAALFLVSSYATAGITAASYDNSNYHSNNSKPTAEDKAKANWKNKKISFADGTFKIKKIAKIKSYTFGSSLVPGLLLVGNYTNRSDEARSVTDFLSDHTNVSNIGKKTESDMNPTAYRESSPEYKQLFRNADDKTRPHKTTECAVHYMSDHGMGEDIPNNFKFQITKANGTVLYSVNLKNLPVVRTNITLDNDNK